MRSEGSGPPADLTTPRLMLRHLSREFLTASLDPAGRDRAEELLGAAVPEEWFALQWLMRLRLADLAADPDFAPWSLRGILLGEGTGRRMIGHIGFHSRPDPPYLAELGLSGVEAGWTIVPAFRRRGFAREAILRMFEWAHFEQGVRRFVASISPDNLPSQALAAGLGFVKIGSQTDEIDGPEDILTLDGAELARRLPTPGGGPM